MKYRVFYYRREASVQLCRAVMYSSRFREATQTTMTLEFVFSLFTIFLFLACLLLRLRFFF